MAGQKNNNDRRSNEQPDEEFTERVLLSMIFDVSQLAENVERLKVTVYAMARDRGIKTPDKQD